MDEDLGRGLCVVSARPWSQLEVGGPFAGVEFHEGSVLPGRLSLFFPVANSIDASGDYWQRARSRILAVDLKVGDGPRESIDRGGYEYRLTPCSLAFERRDPDRMVSLSYRFCRSRPALVLQVDVANTGGERRAFEVAVAQDLSLRTSSSYAPKDKARTEVSDSGSAIYATFDDPETGPAQVFVANAGLAPCSATPGTERPSASFVYRKVLAPDERLSVVLFVGSCRPGEGPREVAALARSYEREVADYEQAVLGTAPPIVTGDPVLDHSVRWATGILAANAHYLDGTVVPMPCPAEYNFFFTHDALKTDLAAVLFDGDRVKRDLLFLAAKASPDGVIPHARYWKDDRYVTEPVQADNWNNLWFPIVCARYFRHWGDRSTVEALFPLVRRCLSRALLGKQADGLVAAARPDWWDIGTSPGPRAYMTLLTIHALRSFAGLSAALGRCPVTARRYEELAAVMRARLTEKLWDDELGYLVNYWADGAKDRHLYIGPLLAAHFGLLDEARAKTLVATARAKLLDPELGVYCAVPMDFGELGGYLKFLGNEAGEQYRYFNGGIWSHGNAWYALALTATGARADAVDFLRRTMTVRGIMESPGGQPAMYEYRDGDRAHAARYGKPDKPQFLWAAGWYLYALYHALGIREGSWGTTIDPFLGEGRRELRFSLAADGRKLAVHVTGQGPYLASVAYDGVPVPSAVVPAEPAGSQVSVVLGRPSTPYVAATDSLLRTAIWAAGERRLEVVLEAFPGHPNETRLVSTRAPKSVTVQGNETVTWRVASDADVCRVTVNFTHGVRRERLSATF